MSRGMIRKFIIFIESCYNIIFIVNQTQYLQKVENVKLTKEIEKLYESRLQQ